MESIKTVFDSGGMILVAVIGVMALFALLFGALCLHISTGLLRFDRRSFGKAFSTHFALIVFALLVFFGTRLAGLIPKHASDVGQGMGRWIVIGILALICVGPPLIVKAAYNCSFMGALVVGVLTGFVESALGTVLLFGLVIALIAVAPEKPKPDSHPEPDVRPSHAQVQSETKTASRNEDLDALVGKSFKTLRSQSAGELLDARVVRRENGVFVIRHKSGIARVAAGDLLRITEEEGDRQQIPARDSSKAADGLTGTREE